MRGPISRTITRARVPTVGMKTASRASATVTSISASRWRFGMAHDPILKERTVRSHRPEGNHGEDVKEYYFYLDNISNALVHEVSRTSILKPHIPTNSSWKKTAGATETIWSTNS